MKMSSTLTHTEISMRDWPLKSALQADLIQALPDGINQDFGRVRLQESSHVLDAKDVGSGFDLKKTLLLK
jgi:hypothetical protein